MNGRSLKPGDRVRVVDEFRNGKPHVKFETGHPPFGAIVRRVPRRCGVFELRATARGGKRANWQPRGLYDIQANHLIKRSRKRMK